MNTVYDFPITLLNGQALNWDHYCGKVLLLVNTASKCGFTPQLAGLEALQQQKSGLAGLEAIKWNFTKFLINRQGHVAARFAPLTKPEKLQSDIERLLAA